MQPWRMWNSWVHHIAFERVEQLSSLQNHFTVRVFSVSYRVTWQSCNRAWNWARNSSISARSGARMCRWWHVSIYSPWWLLIARDALLKKIQIKKNQRPDSTPRELCWTSTEKNGHYSARWRLQLYALNMWRRMDNSLQQCVAHKKKWNPHL